MTNPYQKTVTQVFYNERGSETKVRETTYDLTDITSGSITSEWQSFYKDTFLLKEILRSHSSINGFIDSSSTLYDYDKQSPFKLQHKSTTSAKGQKDLEHYYYNRQGLLDSVSYLTNDSSYSNGLRYTGDSLFYTALQPCKTMKYFYSTGNQVAQTIECDNYLGPVNAPDSVGCRRVINSYKKDTLVQEITTWYRRTGKLISITKQVFDKDGWTIYEEREGGEVAKTKMVKSSSGLIIQRTICTYPPRRKMWTTVINYEYYF